VTPTCRSHGLRRGRYADALPAADLGTILGAIDRCFGLTPDAEVTTEANPETVDPGYLGALRESGFTRLSLGMQSAVPHVLATLERVHQPGRPNSASHGRGQPASSRSAST
jgi:oxygen-independent coproporphyrinogen-3 oxidase